MPEPEVAPAVTMSDLMYVKDLPPGSFLYDRDHAVIVESVFNRLLEYSTSVPTKCAVGKVWRANANHGKPNPEPDWYIRFVTECSPPEDGKVLIHARKASVIEGA